MVNTLVYGRLAIAIWVAWLAYLVGGTVWPASWWLEVSNIRANDHELGRPTVMVLDRSINRNFVGTWVVELRRQESGAWVLECAASSSNAYRTDAALPQPLTLAWWSNGQCVANRAGLWRVDTTWAWKPLPLINKTLTVSSGPFLVTEPRQ